MKTILETVYTLGMENAWIASLSVAAAIVTVAVVCVLGCMVVSEIRMQGHLRNSAGRGTRPLRWRTDR